ncbi:MAG TPA: saccharopine dehydrogenase C-terminal domain-containing protein, partial [Chitinophagales bacterium]|nr:saccharopine dehydrogenase C-terminal domain-containing protein [Chitinophagales bacterium]
LILGAGKSSIYLIDYLAEHAAQQQWQVTVADVSQQLALAKTKGRAGTQALAINLADQSATETLLSTANVVISMLPAAFHWQIAKMCVALKKHLVTPSYISPEMKALHAEVESAGLVFMNEMGLDPGIDHMSALQIIDALKEKGAKVTSFKSHCGGLIAPESDTNLWHYKFTWNPRNVVLAGQGAGGIKYRLNGQMCELKYEELFASAEMITVEGHGNFESYPNRDSLKYISEYGLDDIETMYRGTLRVPPFCKGWNCLVKLGLTREEVVDTASLLRQEDEILKLLAIDKSNETYRLLIQLGLFDKLAAIKGGKINPAVFIQQILEEKWRLQPGDKDMVVMVHEIEYRLGAEKKKIQSSLVCTGDNEEHTAMAKTVGLPVAMVTKMLLNGAISKKGVLMPKYPEIYNPILADLKQYGITFNEIIR